MGYHLKSLKTFTLVAVLALSATAFAGCLQGGDDGGQTGDGYKLTATGVPQSTKANEAFTFKLVIADGPTTTSDHIGAHYGKTSSNEPSTTVYGKACAHTTGTVPGTFDVTCSLSEAGTTYLRGHLRITTDGAQEHYWTDEFTITVEGMPSLGTIKVGTDAAFPPFEDLVDGNFVGFDMDLMREIGNRSGFTPEFQNLGFDPLIPALQNGQIRAAISGMSITENRSKQVDFSIPYYEANQSVMVKAADKGKYADIDSMKGKNLKFGAQTGTVGADNIVEYFGEGAITRYDTYPTALAALKRGDVDAVVMDAPAQKEAAKSDPSVAVAFEYSVGDVYGIPVKKGDTEMLTRINAALASMYADGTIAKLREKWGL